MPYYTCVSGQTPETSQLITLDVTSAAVQVFTKSVSSILPNLNDNHVDLRPLLGNVPGVVFDGKVILLKSNGIHVTDIKLKDDISSVYVVRAIDKNLLLQCRYKDEVINQPN